ncbi:MAG: 3-deoxy-7-phosphoheptulonate synthase [Planctomycetota bacterium]|jgi:3-deoxy-7-phosphoheptulonate synthase
MIIQLNEDVGAPGIGSVEAKIQDLARNILPVQRFGSHLMVLFRNGGSTPEIADTIRGWEEVKEVVSVPEQLDFTSKREGAERSVVRVSEDVEIGGKAVVVMAGPCSVESEAQVLELAAVLKDAGAKMLRGGAFKPRTSPYSFQGLGEAGLEILAAAREKTGMAVVTEVLDTADIDLVAKYTDVFQVGSRNMQNFPLLFKLGRHASGKPVLLKRGAAATVDEFLLAAEYILLGRHLQGRTEPGVVLCERGVRTAASVRNTLDLNAVAEIRQRTHFPIIVDPSHASGDWRLVESLSLAGIAAGADGLLVEVHPDPESALSDGKQSLKPARFAALMERLQPLAAAVGRTV